MLFEAHTNVSSCSFFTSVNDVRDGGEYPECQCLLLLLIEALTNVSYCFVLFLTSANDIREGVEYPFIY